MTRRYCHNVLLLSWALFTLFFYLLTTTPVQATNNYTLARSEHVQEVGSRSDSLQALITSPHSKQSLPLQSPSSEDTRFKWQETQQTILHIHWYNRPKDFGQAVLAKAQNSLDGISKRLGMKKLQPIHVWVYANKEDFHSSLLSNVREWVGAVAFPDQGKASVVVENMQDETLARDLPHELTHLVFHQLIGDNANAPLWLDEGLAVYNQSYHETEMQLRFNGALHKRALLRLQDLTDAFPQDSNQAYLAYAQSWKLVEYMYTTFGQAKMTNLLYSLKEYAISFDQHLQKITQVDTLHLEQQWRLSLKQPGVLVDTQPQQLPQLPPTPKPVLTDHNALLLLMLGVVLIILPFVSMGGLLSYHWHLRQQDFDGR